MRLMTWIFGFGLMFFAPWAIEHIWNNLGHSVLGFASINYLQAFAINTIVGLCKYLLQINYSNICTYASLTPKERMTWLVGIIGATYFGYLLTWLVSYILVQFI